MGHHQQELIPDDGGGGHPATASGGVSWVPGPDGRTPAMHLDGSSGFAETDAAVIDPETSYSVEAWVRLDRLPANFSTAVSQDSGDASAFYLQYSTDERRFAMASIDGHPVRATSADEPKPAVWYQLVGVLDTYSGTRSLYVDGVLQMTVRVPPRAAPAELGQLQIGRAQFGGNPADYWPGSIARVTVYQRALSATEVLELFQAHP
jgi:Concanavalin A-like lectin/glucanases superfamily